MHIDSFSFGSITVDGVEHSSDLLLLPPRIIKSWWRKEGHRLAIEDLAEVITYRPEALLVGCGVSSMMQVTPSTISDLKSFGITVEILPTEEAVRRFNALSEMREKVAAALHLTC